MHNGRIEYRARVLRCCRRRLATATATAALGALAWATGDASAIPQTWDGGAGNFDFRNAQNWNPDAAPNETSDLTFTNAGIPVFGATITWNGSPELGHANSITFATPRALTLQGSNFSLDPLRVVTINRVDGVGTEAPTIIDAPVVNPTEFFVQPMVWDINGSGGLFITGGVSMLLEHLSTSFTKNGNGFLSVGTGNWRGNTFVNGGVLQASFVSGHTTVASGATFQFPFVGEPFSSGIGDMTLSGTGAGGGGALRNFNFLSDVGNVNLATDAVHIQADSGRLRIQGLSDGASSFSWTKGGTGTVEIMAASTFEGDTHIQEGTVIAHHGSALGAAPVHVSAGASVGVGSGATLSNTIELSGSLTGSSGTFADVVQLHNNDATIHTPNVTDAIAVTGAITELTPGLGITKTGPGTATLGGTNSFTGGITVAGGVLVAASAPPAVGGLTVQDGGTLEFGGTVNRAVTVAGAGAAGTGALRSSSAGANWNGSITLTGAASLGANGAGSSLTIGGAISGAGSALTKVGAGDLALTNPANNFASLTVSGGRLNLASHTSIPAAAPINVAAGSLRLTGNTVYNRTLILSGGTLDSDAADNTWAGPVQLATGTSTLAVGAGRKLTISGDISGSSTITKSGLGELVLGGTNSFGGGPHAVAQGTLTAQSAGALPGGLVAVADGALLQLKSSMTASASLRLSGNGTSGQGALFNAAGNSTVGGAVDLFSPTSVGVASGTTLTLAGAVTDSAGPQPLVKTGPGTLALTAANSYRGGTVVNAGTLSVLSDTNLGAAAGAVILNNGSRLLIAANAASARTFNLNTGSIQVNVGNTFTYQGATVGGGFLRGPGTHALTGGSNFSGVTSLAGSNVMQTGPVSLNNFTNGGSFTNNAPLAWDGGFNLGGSLTANSTLATEAFQNGGAITVNSGATLSNSGNDLVNTGGSRVTINPGGTLQLNGTNLNLNGTLAVNNGAIAGGTTNVFFGSLLAGNGSFGTVALHPGGAYTPGTSLSNLPAPAPTGGALVTPLDPDQTSAAPIVLAAHATASVDASDNALTLSGGIAGPGMSLTKTGAGTLTLTGTNTYTGGTNVNAGTLQVHRLHESNPVSVAAGARLEVLDSSPTLPDHPAGDNAFVSRPSSLSIAVDGQLDLTNNDLIVEYTDTSPREQIEDMIGSGFNGGEWNGDGIISTTALNDPNFVLAVAENALLLQPFGDGGAGDDPLFAGQVVDDTTVLVKFTHRVDLDLDGLITGNDAAVFNAFFNEGQPATWQFGDLDYDGVYSGNDAAIFNGFYNESLASVPEPAALRFAACGLALLARRRRPCR